MKQKPISPAKAAPERFFRLLCAEGEAPLVEALLEAQGYRFEPEPYFPLARRLLAEPFPLGGSLAARFGYIYIQDPSSMLPPLALNPAPGSTVLDMCASPGSKTGLLAQLAGPCGFVLGNEPSAKRLATLRRNLEGLNLLQCGTTTQPGEHIPLPDGLWDQIMLDPPCSGWGTAEKNPQVMELWRGDKVKPLVGLQRLLLREAARLLRPGGRLVYSTCTTNIEENEEQVDWATRELGLELLPLVPFRGFSFAEPELDSTPGVLRVAPDSPRGQGFFIAALGKAPGAAWSCQANPAGEPQTEAHFVSPASLEGPLADVSLLPPGALAARNGTLWFYPAPALELLPMPFAWRPFPLGKAALGRPSLALRALMPKAEEAEKRGAAVLNVEDCAPVQALLSGQSLKTPASGTHEVGLYFHGLPLCRLRAQGGRILLAK